MRHIASVRMISIHALREESDFLAPNVRCAMRISIHALREESDQPNPRSLPQQQDFNPRSP